MKKTTIRTIKPLRYPNTGVPRRGSQDLTRTAVNTALALGALGIGIAAYRSLSSS